MTMSPPVRKLALAVHLTMSVGWLGAVVAYLALDLTVATNDDPQLVRGAWIAMGTVASTVIVPLALASLITGLVMALGTKWGLFRHWWVLISFVLTVLATLVLLSETSLISSMAAMAANPATPDDVLLGSQPTLLHSIGGLVVLVLVQVLNVYKPQGLTPYGWRKLQEQRRILQGRSRGDARLQAPSETRVVAGRAGRGAIGTGRPLVSSLAPGSSSCGADASFAAKRSSQIDLEHGLSSGGSFWVVDVDLVDVPHEPLSFAEHPERGRRE